MVVVVEEVGEVKEVEEMGEVEEGGGKNHTITEFTQKCFIEYLTLELNV